MTVGCATSTPVSVDKPVIKCSLIPLPETGPVTPRQIGDALAQQWREVDVCNQANEK